MGKLYLAFGVIMVGISSAANAVPMNAQIRDLIQQKEAKIKKLEECEGKKKGWMIAGISTIGVAAVGVAGNIALANKSNNLTGEIDTSQQTLKAKQDKLSQLQQEAAERERQKAEQERAELAETDENTVEMASTEGKEVQEIEEQGSLAGTVHWIVQSEGEAIPVVKASKAEKPEKAIFQGTEQPTAGSMSGGGDGNCADFCKDEFVPNDSITQKRGIMSFDALNTNSCVRNLACKKKIQAKCDTLNNNICSGQGGYVVTEFQVVYSEDTTRNGYMCGAKRLGPDERCKGKELGDHVGAEPVQSIASMSGVKNYDINGDGYCYKFVDGYVRGNMIKSACNSLKDGEWITWFPDGSVSGISICAESGQESPIGTVPNSETQTKIQNEYDDWVQKGRTLHDYKTIYNCYCRAKDGGVWVFENNISGWGCNTSCSYFCAEEVSRTASFRQALFSE